MPLNDKVILVTGAGRGIGRGVAEAVAEAGAHVVVTDLELSRLAETARAVEGRDRRALLLAMDVTDEEAVGSALSAAVASFGRLDGLVNNAGVLSLSSALDSTSEQWRRQLEVNLQGVATCSRLAVRWMREQGGGAIVNIASNAGKVGYPNMAAYNASKAAVISLTRSLAAEWAALHINVNAVCPGGVETPMLEEVADWLAERSDRAREDLLGSMVPAQLGRHIQPIEVGRVVAFLLSPHAEIIRGQAINVDGGDTPY